MPKNPGTPCRTRNRQCMDLIDARVTLVPELTQVRRLYGEDGAETAAAAAAPAAVTGQQSGPTQRVAHCSA